MNIERYIKDLAPELQEQARACGSVEELLALAKEAKVPVPDEVLETVAGGDAEPVGCGPRYCPRCDSKNLEYSHKEVDQWGNTFVYYRCKDCGHLCYEEEDAD